MINKQIINVPENIEHISDWTSFSLPQGHNIIDKTICGCGFTEYCLRNNVPIILCSPRKVLLENKADQHNNMDDPETGERVPNPNPEFPVYYFKNGFDKSAFDSETKDLDDRELKEMMISYIRDLKEKLISWIDYIKDYKTPKILVTYDSLHHVMDALAKYPIKFYVVVDEFQAIFTDAAFKARVELDFVDDLKLCPDVLYVSATPMLDKYLSELDYFRDLPFYKLVWPDNMIEKVRINRVITRSINAEVSKYIKRYKLGQFENKVVGDKVYVSNELVIFCNSVKTIFDIIKKNSLTPEECNILCSDSASNLTRLKKLGKGFVIGKVPTENEPHKMFTFCTRTVYLGADFYSTCAFTIICSDCNIRTLTVDISLDLPQIIGRQRLKENVFKNEVLFLYKADTKDKAIFNLSKEEFDRIEEDRDRESANLLSLYEKGSETEKQSMSKVKERDSELYMHDFVGVSRTGKIVYNYLVKVATQRAWDVSRVDYQDEVCLKRGIEAGGYELVDKTRKDLYTNNLQEIYKQFTEDFNSSGSFDFKMRVLCDYMIKFPDLFVQYSSILSTNVPRKYQNYISLLGPEKCKALRGSEKLILEELENMDKMDEARRLIVSLFSLGSSYTLRDIKHKLQELYDSLGITNKPKASDLEEYFVIKPCLITNKETGKRDKAYEIIKKR